MQKIRFSRCVEKLAQLPNLKELELRFSSYKNLPENISKLQQIESLTLSQNDFQVLPKTLADLDNLKSVDLSHNERIIDIPMYEVLLGLDGLETLNLAFCKLTKFPEKGSFENLESINLRGNYYEHVGLVFRNVENVNFANNQFLNLEATLQKLDAFPVLKIIRLK